MPLQGTSGSVHCVFDAMRGIVGMKEGNFVPVLASIFTLHSKHKNMAPVCGSAEGLVWPL